jgi:type II secretory pathway pseudopilin PulG
MDETFFYIVGLSLVAAALVVSFVGMRKENFPSDNVLRIGVVIVAAIVVVTGFAAVNSSQQEQQDREREANAAAAEESSQEAASNAEEAGGGSASSEAVQPDQPQSGPGDDANATSGGQADAAAGEQVFVDNGCGSCHTLAEQAEANGNIGPNLDEALGNQDEDFIRTSIIDPSAFVEDGYPDGTMPQTYESQIAPDDLDALVAYLAQATGASGGSGGSSK